MTVKRDIKSILLRAPNWIGDAVMCLPAVDALRSLYPDSGITILARARTMPLFRRPGVALMEYDAKGRHGGASGKLRLASELRARGFDMAVLFQNSFEGALIPSLARIPERVGYDRHKRGFLLTTPVKFTEEIGGMHQVFYYLNIVSAMGGSVTDRMEEATPAIEVTDDEVASALGRISAEGFGGRTLVGAAPGASYGPAKMWGKENFCEALESLSSALGAAPVIFGGPDDSGVAAGLSACLGQRGVRHLNLAGRTSLTEFMALASLMRVFITNDSGPMHVAAALGTPTVAIFGSTEPAHTGPVGRSVVVLQSEIDCSPCFRRTCRYGHYECMKGITPGAVCSAARELILAEPRAAAYGTPVNAAARGK